MLNRWWLIPLLLGWIAICGVWLGLLVAQFRARARGLLLRADNAPPLPQPAPSIAIIIPARNEQANIAGCIESALRQDYPDFHVLAVDDRSEDETLAILRQLAERKPRLDVIHVDALPPGWMGKSHALWTGTRNASADWLLFIDADCRLDPPALRVAVATALANNATFLSLWPRQADGGFWENLLIPLCAGIIALWYGSPDQSRASRSRPFANGQFLLIRRDTYDAIGGHEAVRTAIIEDVILADRAARAGSRCWAGSGRELLAVRMYTSLSEIANGWARIYIGALRSRAKLAVSSLWLALGSLLPYVVLAWLLIAARTHGTLSPLSFLFGAVAVVHLALMMIVSFRFWALGGCRRVYLWLYPLACIVVMSILLRALIVQWRGGAINWRTTQYTIDTEGVITHTGSNNERPVRTSS